jgi:hypothetical protein
MHKIQGIFFLVMGAGLVLVALQGIARGWLPNGPKGFKRGEGVSREEQPVGFWLFFLLYSAGGCSVAIYALRLLFGDAAPLPAH